MNLFSPEAERVANEVKDIDPATLLKTNAASELKEAMLAFAQTYCNRVWPIAFEHLLWLTVQDEIPCDTEAERTAVETIKGLSETAGGWYVWPDDPAFDMPLTSAPVFVSRAHWGFIHANYMINHEKRIELARSKDRQ